MLTRQYLAETIAPRIPELMNPDTQVLQAQGLDAIMELLQNMRGVEFPALVLESRSNGSIQLVEGPLDTFTESLWVMEQTGRGEDEAAAYEAMRRLALRILAALLADYKSGRYDSLLGAWDPSRITYMRRYGGQNARGWEIVLTFRQNFSLTF